MQGISTSKHQHLVDALLHLENLLSKDFGQDIDRQLANELRSELELMHNNYSQRVAALAELIADYHELFHKAKMQFLSRKLKELKKQAGRDDSVLPLLAQNIRLAYGT